MKFTRFIILGVGLIAGLGAAVLAFNLSSVEPSVQEIVQIVEPEVSTKILAATSNLKRGDKLERDSFQWLPWPDGTPPEGFIVLEPGQEEAQIEPWINSTAKNPIFVGDPINSEKLVRPGRSFMASILPSGKRAVATNISISRGAGGFILPNDRVDVLMTRAGQDQTVRTETILENIRVLAVNQILQEEDGIKSVESETATLELTPEQTHILTTARELGDRITLTLRSTEDYNEEVKNQADYLIGALGEKKGIIKLIKRGEVSTFTAK